MKKVSLFLFTVVTLAIPSTYAAEPENLSIAQESLNGTLENKTFLIKNLDNGYIDGNCLTINTKNNQASFESCFDNTESGKARRQIIFIENDRIYSASIFKSEKKYCLNKKNNNEVEWSNRCNGESSKFTFVKPTGYTTDFNKTLLQIKSKDDKCLIINGDKPQLSDCNSAQENAKYFATALLSPMIKVNIENQSSHDVSFSLNAKNPDESLDFVETTSSPRNQTVSMYFPDYASYLNKYPTITIKPSFSHLVDLTSRKLRADEGLNITYHGNNIVNYQKRTSEDVNVGSNWNEPNYIFREDQVSLKPYSKKPTIHPPSSLLTNPQWVMAFFAKENYMPASATMRFRFASDSKIEKQDVGSVRIIYKDDGSTFRLINERGGLGWKEVTDRYYSGYLTYEGITGDDNFGFYDRYGILDNSKWRKGAIFCLRESAAIPICAMLKTNRTSAKDANFSDRNNWQTFPFKTYQANTQIQKGEIFYQGEYPEVEIWYAKSSGKLAALPKNKTSDKDWQYMGIYQKLIQWQFKP